MWTGASSRTSSSPGWSPCPSAEESALPSWPASNKSFDVLLQHMSLCVVRVCILRGLCVVRVCALCGLCVVRVCTLCGLCVVRVCTLCGLCVVRVCTLCGLCVVRVCILCGLCVVRVCILCGLCVVFVCCFVCSLCDLFLCDFGVVFVRCLWLWAVMRHVIALFVFFKFLLQPIVMSVCVVTRAMNGGHWQTVSCDKIVLTNSANSILKMIIPKIPLCF